VTTEMLGNMMHDPAKDLKLGKTSPSGDKAKERLDRSRQEKLHRLRGRGWTSQQRCARLPTRSCSTPVHEGARSLPIVLTMQDADEH